MLNIISCQGNANKNHNKILFHTPSNGYNKKRQAYQVLAGMLRKLNPPSYIVGGNVKWCSHFAQQLLTIPQNVGCRVSNHMTQQFYFRKNKKH